MTELIRELFFQNVYSSLKFSIIVFLLLILTKPVTKRYTAGFRYYSWLAVMIIFLIPFGSLGLSYQIDTPPAVTIVQSGACNLQKWYEENVPKSTVVETISVNDEDIENEEQSAQTEITNTVTYEKPIDISGILSYIWIFGAVLFFSLHMKKYSSFKKTLKRVSYELNDERITGIFNEEKKKLKITSNLGLSISAIVETPMLIGIVNPFIVITGDEYSDDELHLIFRHELTHYKRKDILYKFITLIFVSLNWYNPVAYIMADAIEIDGETSCDEMVLENEEYNLRIFYGQMLINFLKKETMKKSYMTTTFFGGKSGMKKRLTLIANKRARRKGTVVMAVILTLTIMFSISVSAMSNDFFSEIFKGDTSYLADFIKTEKQSVSDENYALTLEQYLVAEEQAVVIFSIEAHSEAAISEFNAVNEDSDNTFWDMDTMCFGPVDWDKASINGFSTGSLSEKFNTKEKKYFVLKCDSIDNKENVDFYIGINKIKGTPKITFPMKSNIETKTLEFDNIKVQYNPISISINYPLVEKDVCDWCNWDGTYFYFRMKDNEIKTFNQLYDISGEEFYADENGNNEATLVYAWAKEIIEPDEIKSIIVNNTEYPVDNVSNGTKVEIDSDLKPFIIKPYVKQHLWVPLRETCDKLGADIKWDSDSNSAIVTYRESTYVITPGTTKVKINDEIVDFYDEANDNTNFIDASGRLIISANILEKMNVDCHGYGSLYNEDGTVNENVMMHIIP